MSNHCYVKGLVYAGSEDGLNIGSNHFMSYHTVLKTSRDFYTAMQEARVVADNISATLSSVAKQPVEVYPYSIFYVFYEQYLTIWEDALTSLCISGLAVFVVTFVLLGFDLRSSIAVLITLAMIIADMIGLMYWWDISLNAVSLVNLVMVSAFCSFDVSVAELYFVTECLRLFCLCAGRGHFSRVLQPYCSCLRRIDRSHSSSSCKNYFD